jgi:hypothetical protein
MAAEDATTDVASEVAAIVEAWNAGEVARRTRSGMLIDLLTDETIEPVLAALPDSLRSEFLSELKTYTSDDPESYAPIESWCGSEEAWKAHHESTRHRFIDVTLPAIRRWLVRTSSS